MVLLATSLLASLAGVFAAALAPDGVSHHVESLDGSGWVVAGDEQFTGS
jgi:hypothetical protein